jgi:hypothetical protein
MRIRHLAVAAIVLPVLHTSAAFAATEHFLGFSEDGTHAFIAIEDGTVKSTRMCVDASVCSVVTEASAGGPVDAYVKAQIGKSKASKSSPLGVALKTEAKDGKTHVILKNGDVERTLPDVDGEKAKLSDSAWRPDGKVVAVTLTTDKTTSVVQVFDVSDLLVGGPAGKKAAEFDLARGQKLMAQKNWSAAGTAFDDALAHDDSNLDAHYGRAAAEARGGIGRTAMIENLTWLSEHAPVIAKAKSLLAKAKDDPAFELWMGEPEVRALVGLPDVTTLDTSARLLERSATWTLQGATCKSSWITLTFKKAGKSGGSVAVDVQGACKGQKTKLSTTGTWSVDDKGATLTLKPIESTPKLPTTATLSLDDTHQQLKLKTDTDELGTFEPGRALIDDSKL